MNKEKVQELFTRFSGQQDLTPFNAMLDSSISLVISKLKDPIYETKPELDYYAASIANFVYQTMVVTYDRKRLYEVAKSLKNAYEERCKPFFWEVNDTL